MAKSISFMRGSGSLNHNNREFIYDNVNPNLTHNNITLVKENLEVAYQKCFGSAIENYNSHQKRKDRKIDGVKGYMNKIKNSGNGEKLFYEHVIQVGNKYDTAVGSADEKVATQILEDYLKEFQENNPNIYVFNAVIHLDETSPHLHIDYIPVAQNYQKGMAKRNSLGKALKEQGIKGNQNKFENVTINWQVIEKNRLEKIMNTYGINRKPDTKLHRKKKSLAAYKSEMAELENKIENISVSLPDNQPAFLKKDKVIIDKSDLDFFGDSQKIINYYKSTFDDKLNSLKAENDHLKVDNINLNQKVAALEKSREELFNELDELENLNEYYCEILIDNNIVPDPDTMTLDGVEASGINDDFMSLDFDREIER